MKGDEDDRDVSATRRSFGPRRALPNGRALLGALFVTTAAVGAFVVAMAGEDGPRAEYLVLTRDLDPGDTLALDDVAAAPMDLSPELASTALQSPDGIGGATALFALRAGSLLDTRDLRGPIDIGGSPVVDRHELTLPVPGERAPASLVPGDRVTVLAYASSDGSLHTAAEDALVIGYAPADSGLGSSGTARLTLALPTAAEVTTATLLSYDSLTVVLTTGAIDDDYPTVLARAAEEAA